MTLGERVFSLLLRLYPRAFRERYREDLLAFFRQDRAHPRHGRGLLRPWHFWAATIRDLVRAASAARVASGRERQPGGRLAGLRLSTLARDVRYGWRGLRSTPGVSIATLVVLTLGIGASTAIFSVVDAVALRPLPFAEPSRLVSVAETDLESGRPSTSAWQNYAEWRLRQQVFETLGASANGGTLTTAGDGPPQRLRVVHITASLFGVLQVAPAIGRPFTGADELRGAPRVALISDRLWRQRFQAAPDVIGQIIPLEDGRLEVAGVMGPDFAYPIGPAFLGEVDVWLPLVPSERDIIRDAGRTYRLQVVARLGPGVTIERAHAQMTQIRDALALDYPRWFEDRGIVVRGLHQSIVSADVRAWMLLLLSSVGFVLLIACLNVANLLLARAVARSREVAVRTALGASRWDLARALIVESLQLSMAGVAGGVLLASWGLAVLRTTLPQQLPRLADLALDLRVLGVAVVVGVVTGVAFGTLPALHLNRVNFAGTLRESGRAQAGAGSGMRIRAGLVVAEVALAVVLLAGAGVFLASFVRVLGIDLGLETRHVLSVGLTPRVPGDYATRLAPSQAAILDALARVRAVPGVLSATVLGGGLPLSGSYVTKPVQRPGRTEPPFRGADEAIEHGVTADYLDVMQGTLIRGRWIQPTDRRGTPPVVVLSDVAASLYFGSADPMGELAEFDGQSRTVVGIARAMRHRGPEAELRPEAFVPFLQSDQPSADIVVRTDGVPGRFVALVESAIREALPDATLYEPDTLDYHFGRLVAQRKFNMMVLAVFGLLGVAIAVVGVYGVMAFLVGERQREIGVRIALGAVPAGILRMVLARASWLLASGLAIGLAGALALERFVRAFLFEAHGPDPLVYGAVAGILLVAGLVAALGPARRAARVDPLVALRAD